MKKSNQMRINDIELVCMYEAVLAKVASFIHHYRDDGSPIYIYSEKNEDTLALYYKLFREMNNRGLYNSEI